MSKGMFGGLDKVLPKEKRKEILDKLQTDPTVVSVLPSSVGGRRPDARNDRGYPTIRDENNRKFHKIFDHPRDQMFLARILKGVIPVSDVIYARDANEFYSYEIPLDLVQPNQHLLDSGVDLLHWIFGDFDHNTLSHNIRKEFDQHAFFDFEEFRNFWGRSGVRSAESIRRVAAQISPDQREAMSELAGKLSEQIGGSKGLQFLQSILDDMKKTGAGVPEVIRKMDGGASDPIREFQSEIMFRIEAVKEGLRGNYDK